MRWRDLFFVKPDHLQPLLYTLGQPGGHMSSERKRALVLAGGGARGGYEAGVLNYILGTFPGRAGIRPRFEIISGTSVGAVNGSYLASRSHLPDYGIDGLIDIWRTLELRDYLRMDMRELLRIGTSILGLRRHRNLLWRRPITGGRLGGLLNTGSLDRLVRSYLEQGAIRQNVLAGHIEALTVTTTEIATGRTVVFIDNKGPTPTWTADIRRVARGARISSEHALASAAIPFLFPAVDIDGRFYCDGSLRQNTPLSPALRLGANRVLVIALGNSGRLSPLGLPERELYPNALFLFGKLLNALLLDPIQYDLVVLERINRILRLGENAFGDRFGATLGEIVGPVRGRQYRIVDTLIIRPGQDIGEVAASAASQFRVRDWGKGPAALMFQRFARAQRAGEDDLLSYLLFDGRYAERLLELGYRDAEQAHDRLVRFFSDV